MSTVALFVVGCGVTLLTVAALALLVYAAVLDGRYDREHGRPVLTPVDADPDLSRAA